MKSIGVFLIGVFLLFGFTANANVNRLEAYFVKKSLNDPYIKVFFQQQNGECHPLLINGDAADHSMIGNCEHCDVSVEQLEVTQDDNGTTYVALVYNINKKVQVSETFVSRDMNSWEPTNRIVKVL